MSTRLCAEELVRQLHSERGYIVFASRFDKQIGDEFLVDPDDVGFIRESKWRVIGTTDKQEFRNSLVAYGISPWIDTNSEFHRFYRCEAMD